MVLPNGEVAESWGWPVHEVVFGDVGVSGGKIIEVGIPLESGSRPIDVTGLIVAPGYIDIHVNGGAGQTFEDADADGLDQVLEMYARHGTTSLLGALNTAPREKRLDSLARVKRWRDVRTGPVDFLGVYLEGPYSGATRSPSGKMDVRSESRGIRNLVRYIWRSDPRGFLSARTRRGIDVYP